MPFLLCLVIAFLITKTINDGKTDRELARQGIVSPRLQAKYGAQAKEKTAQYGLVDFLADAWSDNWRNRTEARRAAEQAVATVKPSTPGAQKPSWRDRLAAVKGAVEKAGRKLVQPVEPKPRPAPALVVDPEPVVEHDPGDFDTRRTCPTCGEVLTKTNGQWWHPDGPTCPTKTTTKPLADPPCDGCKRPFSEHVITDRGGDEPVPVCPTPEPVTTAKEKPVSAPTGEAVNYETTVNELNKLIEACRIWLDKVTAALKSCEEAKGHIEDAQSGYRTAAGVAASILDHLAAMHLDATTLGLIGAIKESLPASDVDVVLALLEEAEAKLTEMRDNAATALGAAEAALAHVVAEYGEEANKVAANLGGDPTFLGSGGGGGSSPAPVSAAH